MVSGNDDVAGEPDGELGRDGGVGWLERVIPPCPPTSPPRLSPPRLYLTVDVKR